MNIMQYSSCPSPTSIERFKQWFSSNGGQLHSCADLVETGDEGYSLKVRPGEDIKDDEIIVSCPITLAFSFVTYAEKDMAGCRSKLNSTSLSQDVILRLYLIEQYLLGAESFWWPYINILPQPSVPRTSAIPPGEATSIAVGKQPFHTPLYFDEEDLFWLKGTNLGAAVDSRASDWREEFDNAKDFIVSVDESEQALWTRFATLQRFLALANLTIREAIYTFGRQQSLQRGLSQHRPFGFPMSTHLYLYLESIS